MICETVDELTNGKPFKKIDDVVSRERLVEINENYKRIAAWDLKSVNR